MRKIESVSRRFATASRLWKRAMGGGLAGLAIAIATVGCTWTMGSTPPLLTEPTGPQPTAATAPPREGVELIAQARGNIVTVTVRNYTGKDLLIGPKMFGVIADGQLHVVNSKQVTIRFPMLVLRHEEAASGAFRFRYFQSLEGQKLVFNSPDTARQMVIIGRREPSKPPNHRALLPPLSRREVRRMQREQERIRKALLRELQK